MFESADLKHKLEKSRYKKIEPKLREDLLHLQFELDQMRKFPVLILINGVEGAGKGETVNTLTSWMDSRHIYTHAFAKPSDEESERPGMWRYWRALPPKGKIGVLFGNWYTDPIHERAQKSIDPSQFDQQLDAVIRFEEMLAHEGVLLLKFWFHLSKDQQRKRLTELEDDPDTRWRVTKADWKIFKMYDRYRKVSEHALRHTSTAHAPWTVVAGADERYRNLLVGQTIHDALKKRLKDEKAGRKPELESVSLPPMADSKNLLNSLKLNQKTKKEDFAEELERQQGRLALLTREAEFRKRSLILVFEGMDAAGKGGAIRRITGALDARQYRVVPIAAPSEEERAQPYLWRFWRHLPRLGRVTIFDRSWYGRVLVERVEGFCSESDWMRAYAEINDFEDQLVQFGGIVAKFWLSISKEEQLKRFKDREVVRFKRFKITEEDWRNRKKWGDYEYAVCDMIDRTSTEIAPWTLVEANNKYFARLKVIRTICDQLEEALNQ